LRSIEARAWRREVLTNGVAWPFDSLNDSLSPCGTLHPAAMGKISHF
jgi:hypothetical protein